MRDTIEKIGVVMILGALIIFILSVFDIGYGCHYTPWGQSCFSGFFGLGIFVVGMILFLSTNIKER